jgi:uncharacterized iron-regulated membrane protein
VSPGTIALAAVIVLGANDAILFGIAGWLVYKQRILLAASPKPQAQKPDKDAQAAPVEPIATVRRTG